MTDSLHTLLEDAPHTPGGDIFLRRMAETIFWMSRYLERAENLARLLDVTHTFSPASQGAQNWQSVLALHRDEGLFFKRYDSLTAMNVMQFYITDDTHPNSIFSCLQQARTNASQLRAVISTEMWVQINVMFNYVRDLDPQQLSEPTLSGLLAYIREQCQLHHGIAESGLYRDQGWYFYVLGRQIERADQTTRLLDIKYHLLLPSVDAVGSTIDASQWFSLLRAASGYHAFRREHPHVVSPATVAGFLLLNRRFPRSVACCLKTISDSLIRLEHHYKLPGIAGIIATNEVLRTPLKHMPIESVIGEGLHEYLDQMQLHLIALSNQIAKEFF
jgi:uncharacterized alpha-E superfamily protein